MAANAQQVDLDEELALLLREQEKFARQSDKPAAKVMRRGGGASAATKQQQQEKPKPKQEEEEPTVAPIVGRVVERDVVRLDLGGARVAPPVRREATGFPSVRRRGESLFGKRQKQSGSRSPSANAPSSSSSSSAGAATMSSDPADQERRDIDAANAATLSAMSPDEIREAQQELLRSLDPALVAKLRSRHSRNDPKRDAPSSSSSSSSSRDPPRRPLGERVVAGAAVVEPSAEQEERAAGAAAAATALDLSKITTEAELQASARLLPPEERAKHEWMQPPTSTPPPKSAPRPPQTKEPATLERFDFDGRELPAEASGRVPAHSGLFHHGDEPEAPGYTMPELLLLARSSVASQRAMALSVVAKVLANRQRQERADPRRVAPKVLPRELPVTLRISLDDQNYTALAAGVSALHALLVPVSWSAERALTSHQFELAFGAVLPPPRVHLHEDAGATDEGGRGGSVWATRPPVVYIDDAPDEDGAAISDEDLAAADPVQALLHMDIGARFRFILESIQLPDQDAAEKMLDVLVAIARHSPKGAREIATNARLVKVLQRKFIENEQVLTAGANASGADTRALRLTLKALVLVRSLCQSERAAASVLVSCGVIQSTKGFLALQGTASGGALKRAELFAMVQIESLRVWRVLLGYALDFHCFAYLFPVLSGFAGADLVAQHASSSASGGAKTGSLAAAALPALFAALEALSGLASEHEAQHYFSQLGFFIDVAADRLADIAHDRKAALASEQAVEASTALRFLAAAARLADKFHLEARGFARAARAVDALVASAAAMDALALTLEGRDLLLAMVVFHGRAVHAELLGDGEDEEEAARSFFKRVRAQLLAAAEEAVKPSDPAATVQACALVVAGADMATRAESSGGGGAGADAIYTAGLYALGLGLVGRLGGGLEFWIAQLFARLLFHRGVLRALGLFRGEADAAGLSNVLAPIYLALVHSTREQEAHSGRLFAPYVTADGAGAALLPRDKTSCHLREPQDEREYAGDHLPLPRDWMYCPFSRMEYVAASAAASADPAPSRAQSDEMTLIVSAACRFLYQFETQWRPQSTAAGAADTLLAEDKLFHLLHVFFAGSDVLFDEHVDAALGQLLAAFVAPVMTDRSAPAPRRLYDGMARNLRRFRRSEGAESEEPAAGAGTFTSDEQLVLTFAEQLVTEFAATSFANAHFARSVALFLAADFPLAVRTWVWKELLASRLLHALAPFDCAGDEGAAVFRRCALGARRSDEQLLQLMAAAVAQELVTPERGPFAYALAVHHLAVYLFAGASALSAARQAMARELLSAPASVRPRVWRHLLSCALDDGPGSGRPFLRLGAVADERVDRVRAQAALSASQRDALEDAVAQAKAHAKTE